MRSWLRIVLLAAFIGSSASLVPSLAKSKITGAFVSYIHFPFSDFQSSDDDRLPDNFRTKIDVFDSNFNIPWLIDSTNTLLIFSPTYSLLRFVYENSPANGSDFESLQKLNVGIIFRHRLTEDWTLLAIGRPGIYSDFENISMDDFLIKGLVSVEQKVSDEFTYGFGGTFSTNFGDHSFFPYVRLNWHISDDWELSFRFPAKLELMYFPSESLELALVVHGTGDIFHLTRGPKRDHDVRWSWGYAAPRFGIELYKGLWFEADGGLTFLRRFDLYKDEVKIANRDLSSQGFIRFTLAYKI